MTESIRAFFAGLIDYAGLFPPAALELAPAIQNYSCYHKEPDAWMLGRFIIPAARLHELDPYVNRPSERGPRLEIAALGRSGADEASFLKGLESDLADIDAFHERHGHHAGVEVYEAKLPATFGNSLFAEAGKLIDSFGEPPLTPYFEAAPGPQWHEAIAAIAHDRATNRRRRCGPMGSKLRCGGVVADAFPTTEQVADSIAKAVTANVPIKCTAGLHHPVRHFNDGVQAKMHGFLNVFGAGILAAVHRLDAGVIRNILDDEDAKSFAFNADGFRWCDLFVSAAQISHARSATMVSFGSCSFDEPREDLRALKIL